MIDNISWGRVASVIKIFIKESVGDKNVVIGLSGGIDSAVVAKLAVDALGAERVQLILLPYGEQKDESDQIAMVDFLKAPSHRINIKNTVDSIISNYGNLDKISSGNVMARIRMTYLYLIANQSNSMVLGTSNKTETMIGYFTKFGDGGVDNEPIGDLYKTQVFELAKHLCIPPQIVDKKPSAGLWEGQTDEGEFGMSYNKLDKILKDYNDGISLPIEECIKVRHMIENSEHKRITPPTCIIPWGFMKEEEA